MSAAAHGDRAPAAAIVLEGVRLTLGQIRFAFDLAVEAGRLAAVIGPSGSGKSTLLALVCGLLAPQAGRILLGGRDVTGEGPADRPVSIVFQDNNLFAHLDIRANVALGLHPGLRLGPDGWQSVDDALARVGLSELGTRLPATLSGGQRQRVALARALVRRRPVLLLDEPFAALGPGLKQDMLALIRTLHQENAMTTLMVTHDPADAAAIADTILFVDAGRIAAAGPAAGFFERDDVVGLTAYLGRPPRGRP